MDDVDYIIGGIVAVITGILYFFQHTLAELGWPIYLSLLSFSSTYGFLVAFFAGILSPFVLFIPGFSSLMVFVFAATGANPLILGISAGLGISIGNLIFILLGHEVDVNELGLKYGYKMKRIRQFFEKRDYLSIFIFGLVPTSNHLALPSFNPKSSNFQKTFLFYSLGGILTSIIVAFLGYYSSLAVNILLGAASPVILYFVFIGTLVLTYAFSRIDWISLVLVTVKNFHSKMFHSVKQFEWNNLFLTIYQFYRGHPFFTLLTFSLFFLYICVELIPPTYHVIIVAYVMLLFQLGVLLEREKNK